MIIEQIIRKQARKAGICMPAYLGLKQNMESNKALLNMYFEGIDFCFNNNFPSNEALIAKSGGKHILRENGVYINEKNEVVESKERLALLDNSEMKATFFEFDTSQIYIKNNSRIEIWAYDNSIVFVDAFDTSIVEVYAFDQAKVVVKQYGNSRVIANSEKVKITVKNSNKYE